MHTQRHRHIVAIPLVALAMLVIAGLNHLMPVHAALVMEEFEVHLEATRDQPFQIGAGMSGLLYAGSVLGANRDGHALTLAQGQVVLIPTGFATLDTGDIRVLFDSSVSVIRDTRTTIVALKNPVIVVKQDTRYVVLFGQQLSVDPAGVVSVSTVSSSWLSETLSKTISTADVDTSRVTSDSYRRLLLDVDPTTDQYRLLLLRLISLGARTDDDVAKQITADIVGDSFLYSALPSMLPQAALLVGTPVQTPLIAAWADSVIASGVRDGNATTTLLVQAAELPSALEERGYPVQATLWRSALLRAIAILRPTVSAESAVLLAQAHVMLTADMRPEDAQVEPSAQYSVPTTSWTFDELRAMTQDVLVRHGALIATSTALVPDISSQTVLVQGVYVAEQGRDVPYTFTYDPALQELRSIIRDGEQLPNAVPVDIFFQ